MMRETLIDDSCLFRAVVENKWDKGMIHGDYEFSPENIANGQCGITSKKFGEYMINLVFRLKSIQTVKQACEQGIVPRDIELLVADDNPAIQRLRQATEGLETARFWYAYGDMRDADTDELLTDDHCWVWGADYQTGEGYDIDQTGDQLSTPDRPVPPVMVQATGKSDGQRVYHVARELTLIDEYKGQDDFGLRFGTLDSRLMSKSEKGWETYGDWPEMAERAQVLKDQCFPGTTIIDLSKSRA